LEIDRNSPSFLASIRDFRRARQRAVLENVIAQLTGKSADLLSYNDIREQLKAGEPVERGLQQIPLSAIVGSVGRYTDFTRSFLPRSKSSSRRWAEVKAAIDRLGEIPPILVYRIDQAYFVLDGNHRVSIARQRGDTHIPAYVTEIKTEVPLSPDVQPDELICKTRYAEFLQDTRLKELRPEADLSMTVAGQYRLLEEQIDIHRYWLSRQQERNVPHREAVQHWYDEVYLPIIEIIQQRGILRHFPERTETDLYVWILQHQAELRDELGWEIEPEVVADDLVEHFSYNPKQVFKRFKRRLLHLLTPEPLDPGPPPGQWRKEQLSIHHDNRLFIDILVPVSGQAAGWHALEQARLFAQREQGRLHGLHVVASAKEKNSAQSQALKAKFDQYCEATQIPGELTFEVGRPPATISRRARWTDLVVIGLSHLPRPQPGDRLISGFGTLVRQCPRPILAVAGQPSPLNCALLAYDGSPKANEALFVAAYLAGKCQIPLIVLTVEEEHINRGTLEHARQYLQARNVPATYVRAQGNISHAIIRTAQLYESDFIIMGGYGFNPVMEVVLGSEVDEILRAKLWPVLICR